MGLELHEETAAAIPFRLERGAVLKKEEEEEEEGKGGLGRYVEMEAAPES